MQPDVASALTEAASLLVVGMVVVFLFLSMLIGAISLMAWLNKLIPDQSMATDANPQRLPSSSSQNSQSISPKTVAVISSAIHQHRQSN